MTKDQEWSHEFTHSSLFKYSLVKKSIRIVIARHIMQNDCLLSHFHEQLKLCILSVANSDHVVSQFLM